MEVLRAIAQAIQKSLRVVAFTGAGISAESGVPTYRGEGGLWNKYDPYLYASIEYFKTNPSYYWNFFREIRYPQMKEVKPNQAHVALAELEKTGNLKTIITQNIDGLHQEAGSSSVIELHGTTRAITCMSCSQEYSMDEVFSKLRVENPPLCSKCKGKLRPAVVFFGESLNPQVLHSAFKEAERCDLLLSVGSSLVVYPAAEIPVRAKQRGAILVIINKESTPLDHLTDYTIHGEAGKILPQMVHYIKEEAG